MKALRKNARRLLGSATAGALALAVSAHTWAQEGPTVPAVIQDQIDESTALMQVTGMALLGVLVVVLSFNWLRRIMK